MASLDDLLSGTNPTPAPTQPAVQPTQEAHGLDATLGDSSQTDTPADKFKQVMDSDSSRNAQILHAADKLNLEPSTVAKNFEPAQKAANAPTPEQVNSTINSDPALAEYANDTKNLSAIHGDLQAHGKFVTAMRDLSKGVNSALGQLSSSPESTIETIDSMTRAVSPDFPKLDLSSLKNNPVKEFFQENADYISSPELNENAFKELKKGNLNPIIGQVLAGIPSTMVAAGLFTLDPAVGGGYVFSDTYANELQKNRDIGLPDSTNALASLAKATIATGTMFIPMNYLSGIYKGIAKNSGDAVASLVLKKALFNGIQGTIGMSGSNAAQTLADAMVDKASGADPKAMDDIADKLKGSALEGAIQGMVFAGVDTFIVSQKPHGEEAPTSQTKLPEELQLDLATKQKENFLKTFEAAQKRKLVTDNPGMAKQQTEEFANKMGVSDVYVPFQEFQTLHQEDAGDVAKQIGPETKKSYDLAEQGISSHIKMPLSEILNTQADIKPEQLADHVKMAPDLPTVTEAKVSKEQAESAAKEQEAKDQEALAKLQQEVEEGIGRGEGKGAEAAKTQAQGITRAFKGLADILKKPVEGLLKTYKFNVNKPQEVLKEIEKEEQEHFQMTLAPEDQKSIFGNTLNIRADQILKSQRNLEGITAAVKDDEGKIYTGYSHAEARNKAPHVEEWKPENQGFLDDKGRFISRDQADKSYGFRTSEELHQMLFQGGRGHVRISGPAGDPQGRTFDIYAHEGADKSTMFHEFSHAFLQILRDHAVQDDATPELKDIETKLLKWFDVKDWSEVTDRHSEMFARGFEYRLWEGKSPTWMTGVFNKFAQWLRKIYPSSQVMEQYLKNVGGTMTSEMRSVYDRFIASSEEIEASEKIMGYNKEEPEGLTPEEVGRWKEEQDKATQASMDALNKRKMNDLKYDALDQQDKERKQAQAQAEKETSELPVFKAEQAIKDLIHSEDVKGLAQRYMAQKSDDIETDALNRVAQETGYTNPLDLAYALSHADRQAEIKDRVDAHMDQFKERVNSGPQEAALATINEERKDAVAHEIAMMEQVLREAKEKATETGPEKKAVTGIKEAKPEMTKEEAAQRRREALKQYHRERAQAKAEADQAQKKLPLSQAMNVRGAVADVKEATKRVNEFKGKNNMDKAQEWRRRQLRAMEMADLAKKAALEVMKKRNEMRRFAKLERKPLTMPNGHWLQIKGLLEKSGIKKQSQVQDDIHRNIAQMMQEKGSDNDEIADKTGWYFTKNGALVPENLEAFRDRMMGTDPDLSGTLGIPENLSMKDMTLSDFRKLNTAVKAIYKNGRDENNLEYEWGQLNKGLAVAQLTSKVKETQPEGWTKKLFGFTDLAAPVFGHITRYANVFDGGDPNGPFNRFIVNPLLKGLALRDQEKIDLLTRLQNVHDEHYPNGEDKDHKKMFSVRTSQGNQFFSKNEAKQIYAYMGQPDGMKALTTGNKYTLQDLRAIIDHLDETDLKYMEAVGKELSKDFPRYVKEKMDLDGIEPEKAETGPVETKFGIRHGFYYPMRYKRDLWQTMTDWGKHPLQETKDLFASRVAQMPFTHYGTNQGFLKSRTGVSGLALDTVNSPLARYVEDTSRFFGVQKATKQVGKILNDKTFMQTMKDQVGPGPMALFRQMVQYVASASQDESTAIDKVFSVPRRLIFAHIIGFRPLLYPLKAGTDLANTLFFGGKYGGLKALSSMKDHGYSFTFDMPDNKGATKQYGFKSEKMRQLVDAVTKKDPMMKMAAINYDWNAQEMTRQFAPTELKNWLQKTTGKNFDLPGPLAGTVAFLKMNTYMTERNADRQVRFPLWWHTYSEARAGGRSEEDAIMDARKMVNDKLGSAEELYHVGPQRGNELWKQIAPVISFAANQFNQWWEHGYRNALVKDKIARNPIVAAMIMTAATTAYYTYPATLKWMINEMPQQDDHKNAKNRFWKDQTDEMFEGIPGLGYLKHGAESGDFGLPTIDWLQENWKGLHTLKDLHRYTERDWQQALDSISVDFPFPNSIEIPTMNFIDHMNKGDQWKWQDFLAKRPLPKATRQKSFLK